MSIEAALKTWGTSKAFAVAGASSNPAKFGYKVFAWYLSRDLPVTPLNPGSASIEVDAETYETKASPSKLDSPQDYSLSVITPPKITLGLLQEAKQAGIRAVWLQPGTFDDEVLAYAKKEWPQGTIAGFEDPDVLRGGEGWCVLVDGDNALKIAGRKAGKL